MLQSTGPAPSAVTRSSGSPTIGGQEKGENNRFCLMYPHPREKEGETDRRYAQKQRPCSIQNPVGKVDDFNKRVQEYVGYYVQKIKRRGTDGNKKN